MTLRTIILGSPQSGKTTLALKLGDRDSVPVRHMDSLIGKHDWSGMSQEISTWFDADGPWIIEGVAGARALRKWLDRNPDGKPCDVIYNLTEPHIPLIKGQESMRKGCVSVWAEIDFQLDARGVEIYYSAPTFEQP